MAARDVSTLTPLAPTFGSTRLALHQVAEQIVAPARKPDNEIALRQTPGGVGTPVFEFDGQAWQVRVDGAELVVRQGGAERRGKLTTLAEAAELVGPELYPAGAPTSSEPLDVDPAAAAQLGDFYAFGRAVLAELAVEWYGAGREDPSLIQLWPEHFDIGLEAGPEAAGTRANYGASPGDDAHPEPYLYVGPWTAEVQGDLWNGRGFHGAELDYSEIVAADDQVGFAVRFLSARKEALEGMEASG